VWFRSVFLKTLRDCRFGILGWGIGMGLLTPLMFKVTVAVLAGSSAIRAETMALARNPVVRLFAEPVDVLTPGGYATWRLSMLLPMLAIWALLTVTRMLRGEEENGALDVILSTPRSRTRVAVEKLAAVATALLVIGLFIGLLALTGAVLLRIALGADRALLFGLNVSLFAMVFGALAFLVSQFTRERRPAAGITGVLLGGSFVLASAGRVVPGGEWMGRISPLYYFELNKPLVAGHPLSAGALIVLLAAAGVCTAIGLALLVRRDVGAPFPRGELYFRERKPHRALPLRAWSLRSSFARSLRATVASAIWWGIALACYAMALTALLRQVQQNLENLVRDLAAGNPMIAEIVTRVSRGGDVGANLMFLNFVFTLLVVIVAAFAVSTASGWAYEEEEGRLGLVLAAPCARHRVILEHFLTSALALAMVTGFIFAGTVLGASVVGLQLATGRVALAAFGMVPVGLVVSSAGYLLSGWLRTRTVTATLIAFVLASFVVALLARLLHWPDGILQLSIFEQYGSPLIDGLRPSRMLALLAVAGAALAVATTRFAHKDIVR
jgi:polyether ionophore transport system permease protein